MVWNGIVWYMVSYGMVWNGMRRMFDQSNCGHPVLHHHQRQNIGNQFSRRRLKFERYIKLGLIHHWRISTQIMHDNILESPVTELGSIFWTLFNLTVFPTLNGERKNLTKGKFQPCLSVIKKDLFSKNYIDFEY